ncbi:DedA family protein [Pseudalkalibacillus berkeleyi]|uniref:DedA family protein n=1 Tax=Pseudalkalibacillus berkeleyi TaxID=1069813 RepID=A0ABS9GYB8_9BACL|nr:DedA family protein [Pseudalkalibacillus berkeleyi]MCF6136634.1 DedA family protein [Pseudalkalibacillus berkeleyi]
MSFDEVMAAIETYGYWIILVTLFCGIVGIPAPEETFMVLIGMLAAQFHLDLGWTLMSAFSGTVLGLIASYAIGRYLGIPFIKKYGRFIKITPELWGKVSEKFHRHGKVTILFSLFLPGLRQIAPYVAGTSSYPAVLYVVLGLIGSFLWTFSYILVGFWVGDRLPLEILPWLSVLMVVLFVGAIFVKKVKWKGGSEA